MHILIKKLEIKHKLNLLFQHERREDIIPELKRRKEDDKRMFL